MRRSLAVFALFLAATFLFSARPSNAQDRAWKDCVRRAATAAGVSDSYILINQERDDFGGDTYILRWEVRSNDPDRQQGYCEVHRRDVRVVRFETTPFRRERGREEGYQEPPYTGEYPRVRVDTDGKGYFTSRSFRIDRLDRGYVDTKEQPSISLLGKNGARITFYGAIVAADGRRELTMRITSSDHGDARGRVYIRLNSDRNEVEWISLNGFLEGNGEMKAEFNRNR